MFLCNEVHALSVRISLEFETKAPDILRHHLVGGKVHTFLLVVQPSDSEVQLVTSKMVSLLIKGLSVNCRLKHVELLIAYSLQHPVFSGCHGVSLLAIFPASGRSFIISQGEAPPTWRSFVVPASESHTIQHTREQIEIYFIAVLDC